MVKQHKLILIVNIILLVCLIMLPNFVHAIDPNDYDPSQKPVSGTSVNEITDKANNIIGTITTVGIVIAAITIIILGLKYMIGSVEEKAEYKKTMIPYLVGALLIFGASAITMVVVNVASSLSAGNTAS